MSELRETSPETKSPLAAAGQDEPAPDHRSRSLRWRRPSALAVAVVLVALVAGVWVAQATRPRERVVEFADQGAPASRPQAEARRDPRWEALPRAPLSPRWGAFSAWTGSEFVVWGGYANVGTPQEATADDGAAFNPDTGRWRRLAAAPVEAMYGGVSLWTGRELWILGGIGEPHGRESKSAAAAYDASSNVWRVLPDLPAVITAGAWSAETRQAVVATVDSQTRHVSAWMLDVDGDHWVALPSLPSLKVDDGADPGLSIAAGDNRAFVVTGDKTLAVRLDQPDEWTAIADRPPLDGAVAGILTAWTGTGVLVTTAEAATLYDAATQTWREVPPPPEMQGAQYALHATAGGHPVAVDEPTRSIAAFDPERARWEALPDAPQPVGNSAAVAAATHQGELHVFVWGGSDQSNMPLGNGAVFRPAP